MPRFKARQQPISLFAALLAILVFSASEHASADFIGHGGMIRAIDVSPDTGNVLTASFDFSAKLWQFDEQRELVSLDHHDGPVNGVRFLPGSERAVSVGADGQTVVWSLLDGSVEKTFTDHAGRVMALGISPDGQRMMTGGWDGLLVIRSIDDIAEPIVIDTGVPLVAASFADDGNRVIGGGRDGRLVVHRIADGIRTAEIPAHNLGLTAIAATPMADRVITIGLDNYARVWRTRDMRMVSEFKAQPDVKPVAVTVDGDGRTAAITYIDGLLVQIDALTADVINGFKVDERPVFAVELSQDGNFALTAGMDESAKVWHLASGDQITVAGLDDQGIPKPWLETDEPGAVLYRKCSNCHALSPDEIQRSGPHFQGLFGRRAGTVEGYRYSDALLNSDIIWTPETVAGLFRDGPDHYIPGTKMPVQQVRDEDQLQALVEYMQTIVPK